jgi:ABC-type Zn uptake system ZnuABC Zn-binding protein ZnuA
MSDAYLALMALNTLWLVGLTVVNVARRPGEEAAKAAASASAAAEALTSRLGILEAHMQHVPSHDELNALERRMQGIQAALQGLQASQEAAQRTLSLIQDYMLNGRRAP